ncbi:DUF2147 domain-containing protein [Chryseobacterium taichungense]|uniref:DUF2147 domain-containing protein n=1 Tax=Chryseobacterium taichungense TaxID=295069 RepID=UPI0028AC3FD5|nr:DUF2147 domain-containing protein [Chryseobacterium taichungense]
MKNLFKTARIIFPLVFLILGMHVKAQTSQDKLIGKWTNEEKTRVIEFVKNGNYYDAIIRKAEDNNVIGKKQISGLKPAGNGNYTNGTVYIIKKGKTASCSAQITKDDLLNIKASYGMMSKTQVWKRL